MDNVLFEKALPARAEENTRLIVQISCVATLGGFLFGFDSGVINGTVEGLSTTFHASSAVVGLVVASMLLGCALGAFFAGRVSDLWGRRAVLIISSVLFLLSALGAGVAGTALLFVAARVMGGLAVGAASVIAPAYIGEVAPARYRGRLATVQQIAIIGGLSCAFLSNYLLAKAAGASTEALWLNQAAWRWMFWMQALPSSLFFVSLLFIPESPRYLVAAKARSGSLRRADPAVWRRQGANHVGRDRRLAGARPPSPAPVRPGGQGQRQDPPASSGSASAWRRFSSWSASTWCSTTARCCGRPSAFPRTMRC